MFPRRRYFILGLIFLVAMVITYHMITPPELSHDNRALEAPEEPQKQPVDHSDQENAAGESEKKPKRPPLPDPDEEYDANYIMAKMQFQKFKQKYEQGLFGEPANNKKDDNWVEEEKEEEEDYGDDDMLDFGDIMAGDTWDNRREFINRLRERLKPFQLSYNGDENKALDTEMHIHGSPEQPNDDKEVGNNQNTTACKYNNKLATVLSEDNLVRHCITGDVIGRVPNKYQTRLFSGKSGQSPRNSPEDKQRRQESFQDVYHSKAWGHSWDGQQKEGELGLSGRGATVAWTQEAVAGLHAIISHIKMKTGKTRVKLLDAPCGDMVWMSRFMETRDDIDYTGIDIVPELIQRHHDTYKSTAWKFLHLDLVEDQLPETYDLILSRTLLQHLYTPDVFKLLKKLSVGGHGYLFVTTFSKQYYNAELDLSDNPGRVRELNLEIPPFSLTPPLCLQRDGPPGDFEGWKHFLGLWKLPLSQVAGCDRTKEFTLTGTQQKIISCIEWSPYINLD